MGSNNHAAVGVRQAEMLKHCDLVGTIRSRSLKASQPSVISQVTQVMTSVRHYLFFSSVGNNSLKRFPIPEGNLDIHLPWCTEKKLSTCGETDSTKMRAVPGGERPRQGNSDSGSVRSAQKLRSVSDNNDTKPRWSMDFAMRNAKKTRECGKPGRRSSNNLKAEKQRNWKLLNIYPEGLMKFHYGDFRETVIDIAEKFLYVFLSKHARKGLPLKERRRILRSMIHLIVALQQASVFDGGDRDMEQDFAKYHCTVLVTEAIGDEQKPAVPSWLHCLPFPLFVGRFRRWISEAISKRDLSFMFSIMNTKNAWPALGEARWWEALQGHKEKICPKKEIPWLEDDAKDSIIEAAMVCVGQYLVNQDPDFICPTPSSSLQFNREKGGCARNFDPMEDVLANRRTDAFTRECERMQRSLACYMELSGERMEIESLCSAHDAWRKATFSKGTEKSLGGADDVFQNGPDYGHCKVVAVEKPAGVRIVTIHDANMAAAIQPAQKQLLNAWKSCPYTTMMDGVEEKINSILKRTEDYRFSEQWSARYPDDEWVWISGDYKDATDLLKMSATWCALVGLEGFGLLNYDLCFASLQPLKVHYPPKGAYPKRRYKQSKEEKAEFESQTNGQMMGHWLSFPLLCIINYATIILTINRWIEMSKDIWEAELRARCGQILRRNVLINGDDILFRCPKSFYQLWLKTVGEFGFKVSMGKNYQSPDFVMINSRYFKLQDQKMVELGYLNLRLVYGKNRSMDENGGEVTPDMIGANLGKMVRLCPWSAGCIPHAMGRAEDLKSAEGWFQPNWFLPAHLGGYGVPIEFAPSGQISVSPEQRMVAAWMIQNPNKASLYTNLKDSRTRSPACLKVLNRFVDVFMLPSVKLENLGEPTFQECERIALLDSILYGEESVEIPEYLVYITQTYLDMVKFSTSAEDQLNDWQMRSLSMARAMQKKTKIISPVKDVNPGALRALKRSGYLSPLSNEGFARYWEPNWHTYAKPGLRPTSILMGKRDSYQKRMELTVDTRQEIKKCHKARCFKILKDSVLDGEKVITGDPWPQRLKSADRLEAWQRLNSFSPHWGETIQTVRAVGARSWRIVRS